MNQHLPTPRYRYHRNHRDDAILHGGVSNPACKQKEL